MKKIGIIGGLGPQSTELFYREFIKLCQTRKEVEYPNMLINSMNLWEFVHLLRDKKSTFNLVKKEISKIQDIDFEILSEQEEYKLNSLIFNKMLHGKNYDEMHKLLVKDIQLLKNNGCNGIILACTELPLFIKQEDVDVKLFASTNILAKSVFEKAFK